jgi:hypothetical protein
MKYIHTSSLTNNNHIPRQRKKKEDKYDRNGRLLDRYKNNNKLNEQENAQADADPTPRDMKNTNKSKKPLFQRLEEIAAKKEGEVSLA